MRQVAGYGCRWLGGAMFALGAYATLGGGGFTKAEAESAPFVLVRVFEAVQSAALMVSGAVLFAGGVVAARDGDSAAGRQ